MTKVLILIAAAGASTRMRGSDKLLEEIEGEPLLTRTARHAVATRAPVLATIPEGNERRHGALAGTGVEVQEIDASEGMAASLRAGATEARRIGAVGLMVHLADMPEIGTEDFSSLISAFLEDPDKILRATAASGKPGHPVLFPARLFPELARLSGDRGARAILAREQQIRNLALPGTRALTDLDTPEDWAAWRQRRETS
ncbi:nucleotidyltransferase family protein [Ostreiculturibacter nitratireducens]|uniref:nucleotidyltransferase family protein n=1 Tax=Ostreiculturibacter nitratireducens TaxID=3075226 RepID=UPI0031B601CB